MLLNEAFKKSRKIALVLSTSPNTLKGGCAVFKVLKQVSHFAAQCIGPCFFLPPITRIAANENLCSALDWRILIAIGIRQYLCYALY